MKDYKLSRWVKASERLPVLPNPLPPNTEDEEGVIFRNQTHSCTHIWFPSYGYDPVLTVTEDGHWNLDQWEWLDYALSNPLEQSEKKEEWVSVETQLPENEQWVLVAKKFKSGYDIMLMAHQFYNSFNGYENCFIPYGEPTGYTDLSHWKPLPKPPKNLV